MARTETRQISIRPEPELREWLEQEARRTRRSINQQVLSILWETMLAERGTTVITPDADA